MKVVVVLSGGLDSSVLLADLHAKGQDLLALSVDYGQRHRRELDAAEAIAALYDVPWHLARLENLRDILGGSSQTSDAIAVPHGHYTDESMKQTVVPNRNMILLAVAGALAINRKADAIAYAAHAGDHAIYPDCRPAFTEALAPALHLAGWDPIALLTPFIAWTKADIVRRGAMLKAPFILTYSCYEGGPQHCGECGTCVERREAFALADIYDPTLYALNLHA